MFPSTLKFKFSLLQTGVSSTTRGWTYSSAVDTRPGSLWTQKQSWTTKSFIFGTEKILTNFSFSMVRNVESNNFGLDRTGTRSKGANYYRLSSGTCTSSGLIVSHTPSFFLLLAREDRQTNNNFLLWAGKQRLRELEK